MLWSIDGYNILYTYHSPQSSYQLWKTHKVHMRVLIIVGFLWKHWYVCFIKLLRNTEPSLQICCNIAITCEQYLYKAIATILLTLAFHVSPRWYQLITRRRRIVPSVTETTKSISKVDCFLCTKMFLRIILISCVFLSVSQAIWHRGHHGNHGHGMNHGSHYPRHKTVVMNPPPETKKYK